MALTQQQQDEICDSLIDALPYCDKDDLNEPDYYVGLIEGNINCKCNTTLTYDQYNEVMEYAKTKWIEIICEL